MRSLLATIVLTLALPGNAVAAAPEPGTPEYSQRDKQNMSDAYGRQTAPDGQFNNPDYHAALQFESIDNGFRQIAEQAAAANRLALTPGQWFPGWNTGNPFRRGWAGRRGIQVPVSWTNRYGALIRGNVFAPLPGATDPYTGQELKPPYPGVVVTTGSVQGSERMYFWLAQDLAERGYLVLTYDVQGQGRSETLPHQDGENNALPFCNPFAEPAEGESYGCPGVPAQQDSNFVFGTQDALSFFLSTPAKPYPNPSGADQPVNAFNPLWKLWDRSPDARTVTPGRTTRVAIIGHSLGARAISYVQGVDDRVQVAVALDKLGLGGEVKPVVPALALQAEYGFNVTPYWMSEGSSIAPRPGSPAEGPDPKREQAGGFDLWRKAGVDTMLVVPRASTHLEWTDIPYALPASRYGQAFSSYYVQAWLDRYMKHQGEPAPEPKARSKRKQRRLTKRWRQQRARLAQAPDPLLAERFEYLEPQGIGKWEPVKLERAKQLSFYYCSGWAFRDRVTGRMKTNLDPAGVGCPE